MARRFADFAGATTRRVLAACTLATVLLTARVAPAAPKSAQAKAAYTKGLKAYNAKHYAAASVALGESYGLEADRDTLIVWAQAERQLGRCENAIELYDRLLALNLFDDKVGWLQTQRAECKVILDAANQAAHPIEPARPPDVVVEPPPTAALEGRPWWKDPLGDTLAGGGLVGLGVGIGFLVSARAADTSKAAATNYFEFTAQHDRAERNGRIGVIAATAGVVLLTAAVVRYATRDDGSHRATLTAWLDRDHAAGGFVVVGGF
ncbi:MAG: hypothetical protein H0T79_15165 [Deltaproteobacteria bacterium]|nr:hypothetical protein [Deltaproteobacteria bacterium]